MKSFQRIAIFVFGFTICGACLGVEDTNVIAYGDWSEPIANQYGNKVRGRLLMCSYPEHRGGPTNRSDVGVYIELQEYSDSIGALYVFCDFTKGLKCNVVDSFGKSPPPVGTGSSGGAPGPLWVTLPPFASVRLRANVYAGGRLQDGSLGLWFAGAGEWTIKRTDTNMYFLSATLTVNPPANTNNFNHADIWAGSLKLPKMRIPRPNE